MDPDWDSVMQFVADPLDGDYSQKQGLHSERPALQVPTPPQSHDGSPVVDDPAETNTLVSVSTTFHPAAQLHSITPDIVLLSSDNVFFYVHSHILIAASENGFRGHLPQPPSPSKDQNSLAIVSIPENSVVLNILLHSVYDISCAPYSPTFPSLVTTVNRLPVYGIPPKLYALAASYDLYDLAVSTSSHLLSFPLSTLTDQMAERIGPVYLKRLFFLHFGRTDALKRVLLPPPHPHPPTALCDFTEQKKLTRAWALASAYLAWDARPDLSTSTMESALDCQQALRDRIKNLVMQWSVVKVRDPFVSMHSFCNDLTAQRTI
ncbi:hypothetical protein CPB84DRAFT_1811342 [Gymnopilus junonius]|uniref:BTB domain-containing protein n=1 Tax=Gymnopilus junonius TaxID=109634 RepID=A0A9P5TVN2_GYMJU|nr:hypothetical protein CPB84DRAFT_1811342 [Gymnopilus junonius]